jgi:predicted ATPase
MEGSDHADVAVVEFQRALSLARQRGLKLLELRAATDLARLWAEQGHRRQAHALLAPVYEWFTEGFDTADVQTAKAVLANL